MREFIILQHIDPLGRNYIQTLPCSFSVTVASNQTDLYFDLFYEGGTFRAYIVQDNASHEIMQAISLLSISQRGTLYQKLTEHIIKGMTGFIINTYHRLMPFNLNGALKTWREYALDVIEDIADGKV